MSVKLLACLKKNDNDELFLKMQMYFKMSVHYSFHQNVHQEQNSVNKASLRTYQAYFSIVLFHLPLVYQYHDQLVKRSESMFLNEVSH